MGEAKRKQNEQVDGFMDWAFGVDHRELDGDALRNRWNDKHSDIFPVDSKADPRKLLPQMVFHYLKTKVDDE